MMKEKTKFDLGLTLLILTLPILIMAYFMNNIVGGLITSICMCYTLIFVCYALTQVCFKERKVGSKREN